MRASKRLTRRTAKVHEETRRDRLLITRRPMSGGGVRKQYRAFLDATVSNSFSFLQRSNGRIKMKT
jgi:hypothetical protein